MIRLSLVATLCISVLAAGASQAKTYSCAITPDSSRDWIPETLVFNIDDSSGKVRVFDTIIEEYVGKPIVGKLSVETSKRITITWETRKVSDNLQRSTARFLFRASYYKDNGLMNISSIPGGFLNYFGGHGRCNVNGDTGWSAAVAGAKGGSFSARGKARFVSEYSLN